jgi:transcription elongation GreA/GreB family factor
VIHLDKSKLIDALREQVSTELRSLRDSQRAVQEGAIHEETRQEDPKDTRAIEAQYVSRGLAERVEDLQRSIEALSRLRLDTFGPDDPIGLSALVGLKDGDAEKIYFLVPVAGGEALVVDEKSVRTLTLESPLGVALSGKYVDDDVELELPGRRVCATVGWVC